MIASLGEHGVDPADLSPALMSTHTVKNPEFDPIAKKQAEAEDEQVADEANADDANPPPPYEPPDYDDPRETPPETPKISIDPPTPRKLNPFGDDDEDNDPVTPTQQRPQPQFHEQEVDGDMGYSTNDHEGVSTVSTPPTSTGGGIDPGPSGQSSSSSVAEATAPPDQPDTASDEKAVEVDDAALPSLPGVSTVLTNKDEFVTLDIRWTVVSLWTQSKMSPDA